MTVSYLKEAALLEDVANELIQVHQTLVVPDMVGENRQHHGVLWRTERIGKKGKRESQQRETKLKRGKKQEETGNGDHALYERRVCFERKCDEEIARMKRERIDRGNRQGEINQPVIIY